MSRLRTSAIAAAAILVLVHVCIVALRYGSETASLWGDWIDTLAPLVATVVCWLSSRRAGPFGRRVWRLAAFSALLSSIGQALYTEYYDYLHAPLGTLWPSDVLVFFWVVPIVMTLFLSPRDPGSGHEWLRVFDFAQVCTLALAVELSEIYVPSRWQAAGQTMQLRALHNGILFFGLVVVSFAIRALASRNRVERAYFGRMGGFLAVHSIVLNGTLYYQASGHYKQGEWPDLTWTIAFSLLILIAGTWNEKEEDVEVKSQSRSLQLLAQFSPLVIPAVVFPLVLSIAREQFYWSVALVLISFAAAGGRLFVVQRQLLVSSQDLQKNLALLQGILESTIDAVFVKDIEGRYVMVNPAAARFVGMTVHEVLGKTDVEIFTPATGRGWISIRSRTDFPHHERTVPRCRREDCRRIGDSARYYGAQAGGGGVSAIATEAADAHREYAAGGSGMGSALPRSQLESIGGEDFRVFARRGGRAERGVHRTRPIAFTSQRSVAGIGEEGGRKSQHKQQCDERWSNHFLRVVQHSAGE